MRNVFLKGFCVILSMICISGCTSNGAQKDVPKISFEEGHKPLVGEWDLVFHLDDKETRTLTFQNIEGFLICTIDGKSISPKFSGNSFEFETKEALFDGRPMGKTIWGKLKMVVLLTRYLGMKLFRCSLIKSPSN